MPIYNKLVRDYIPTIIERTGKSFTTKLLDEVEYKKALQVKSQEELQEYLNANTNEEALEELADLLEVIRALAVNHGADLHKVEEIRARKERERGGFMDRVFLVEVRD